MKPIGHFRRGENYLAMLTPYLLIGLGAFLGANCRYLVGGWAANLLGAGFPYGTLIINVSGSFVIGLFLALISGRFVTPPGVRLFFAVGFLGAYTTFSTFTYESLTLLQSRAYLAALIDLLGSVILGMLAVALGAFVGDLV
ncbi:MAG TPA: fluoride efflux transporter CrcB [Chloroflexota bacterium]|nr:fluoride efflux transporter CrcB [Chloroflexota bacterium]